MDHRLVKVDGMELKISNPEKLLFPHVSKWEFILTYYRLAPYLLPYCRDRALTTIRFPDGVNGKSFYQKNVPAHRPDWIETKRDGEVEYVLLNNAPTLIWLANLACVELHVSFNTIHDPLMPTELVFDLDPSVPDFLRVVEVALLIRELLHKLNLDGIVKTSGASGLQIYIPLEPRYTYEQTRKVGKFISHYLAELHPALVTVERMVNKRGNKVYFDYLQHWHKKTLIAPYSLRAVPEATVSTPLLWEELTPELTPKQFTSANIFDRLEKKGDLFADGLRKKIRLDDILQFIERHRL
ncbi:non-homologous end-joining DNA ligase [Laceyella putida]|uniref:Non-homologous end-joining DNA ligase n=1 Tax=Laceyella putida TaxID=110101 RepID=A0ABW2RHS6_9BACL